MIDQNNRQTFEPGDIVQFNGWFKKIFNVHTCSNIGVLIDTPMIILKLSSLTTRPSCESDMTDKKVIDYFMYDVIQGDKRFEISEAWVELVS